MKSNLRESHWTIFKSFFTVIRTEIFNKKGLIENLKSLFSILNTCIKNILIIILMIVFIIGFPIFVPIVRYLLYVHQVNTWKHYYKWNPFDDNFEMNYRETKNKIFEAWRKSNEN